MEQFKPAILHLPHNVGGHPGGLAKAERREGFSSRVLVYGDSPFGYPYDDIVPVESSGPIYAEALRWRTFWVSIFRFDVFHFNFGQKFLNFPVLWRKPGETGARSWMRIAFCAYTSIFGTFDLWFLRLLGKKIVVTFQGDDARQGDRALELFPIHFVRNVREGYYDLASDVRKRTIISIWDKYADVIFALNPDLLHVLPKRAIFLPYAHVDLSDSRWEPFYPDLPADRAIRILHAPSDRAVKGTTFLMDAIERLKTEGVKIDLQLVEGLTFDEAQRLYRSCDLVVDQLLAGWYGGFAVEVMALGKPVIAYLRDADLALVPDEMRMEIPVVSATPDTIYDVLKQLVLNADILNQLGRRSRAYVEAWHDSRIVARQVRSECERLVR